MQDYRDYQSQLKQTEAEEKQASDTVENVVPGVFLIVFCAISAGATFYLNHTGIAASPFYTRFVSPEYAAFLILFILEGSFIALSLMGHKILKSEQQRRIGNMGLVALKVVLSLNILVAFLHLIKITSAPMLEAYAQYGAPITIIGSGALWSYLVAHRRKTMLRNQMLDDAAKARSLWAEQYRDDQKKYRAAYNTIANSQEMNQLREMLAVRHAIEQIALQCSVSFEEAAKSYYQMKNREKEQSSFYRASSQWPDPPRLEARLIEIPGHPITPDFQLPSSPIMPAAASSAPSPAPPPPIQNQVMASPGQLTADELALIEDLRAGKIRSH